MQGKIALEEHFAMPETVSESRGFFADNVWPELQSRLLDIHERRLREMDRHGIELMILSLNGPSVQAAWDAKRAIELARRANDFLAAEVAKRPSRFRGFAALPMQDPDAAAREIHRCVTELGFVGAMVNGFSQIDRAESMVYLDDARVCAGNCRACASPYVLGSLRSPSEAADRSGAYGGGPAVLDLAMRQPQRVDRDAAALSGEEKARRISAAELSHDDFRRLPHSGVDQRHARSRLGPYHVLRRLALRECRLRRELV